MATEQELRDAINAWVNAQSEWKRAEARLYASHRKVTEAADRVMALVKEAGG